MTIPALYDHVFMVIMENKLYTDVVGSGSAPYINNTLIPAGALAGTNYTNTNTGGLSLPNYLDLFAGSEFGVVDDNNPPANNVQSANNLVDLVEQNGGTFRTYADLYPGGSGTSTITDGDVTGPPAYVEHHVPAAYFTNVRNNSARCLNVQDFTNFSAAHDFSTTVDNAPTFGWIVPNNTNNMHDGTIAQGDTWLSTNVPLIQASKAWTSKRCLLIVVWDESSGTGQQNVPCILLSSDGSVRTNYIATDTRNHYSTLVTVEYALGLNSLGRNDANASTLNVFLPLYSTIVSGLTAGTSYTFTAHATNASGTSVESAASSAVIPTAPMSPMLPPALAATGPMPLRRTGRERYRYAASITPSGVINNQALSGALSFAGSLPWAAARAVAATLPFTGNLARQGGKTLTAALTATGALARRVGRNLSAGLPLAGVLLRASARALTAGLASTGALQRSTARQLAATLTLAGAFAHALGKAFAATLTFTGGVGRSTGRGLAAGLASAGTLSRSTARGLAASLTPTGTLPWQLARALAAAASFTGSLLSGALHTKALTAAVTFTGNIAHGFGKTLTATVSFTGVIVRQPSKALTAALTLAGTTTRQTVRGLAAALTFTGAIGRGFSRTLTAGLGLVGNIGRRTGKALGAALGFVGSLASAAASGFVYGTVTSGAALSGISTNGVTLSGTATSGAQLGASVTGGSPV